MIKKCTICNKEFDGGNKAEYCDKCREKVQKYMRKQYYNKKKTAEGNKEFQIREDCLMYDSKKKKCKGLKQLYCKFEICKFYKKR